MSMQIQWSNIVIKEEDITIDILKEAHPHLEEQHKETDIFTDEFKFNPNYQLYLQLADINAAIAVVARREGKMVGAAVGFIAPSLHSIDNIQGICDFIFVKKEYRKGLLGFKLLRKYEEIMTSKGVCTLTLHTKSFLPMDSLLERTGWSCIEKLYVKRVNNGN